MIDKNELEQIKKEISDKYIQKRDAMTERHLLEFAKLKKEYMRELENMLKEKVRNDSD